MLTSPWQTSSLSGATNYTQPRPVTAALLPNASPTLPPTGAKEEVPVVPPKRRLSAWNWLPLRLA